MRSLLAEKCELWLTYFTEKNGEKLKSEFPEVMVSRLDVRSPTAIDELLSEVADSWNGELDGLVYAAGAGLLWPASLISDEQQKNLWEINVLGAQRILRGSFSLLKRGNRASVVLISSVMGMCGAGGMSAYGASKMAVAGFARSLAIEWAPRKIRVNSVAPGIIPSPLVERMFKYLSLEQRDEILKRHPMGFGEAGDVGNAVRFLLSPDSKWVTGVVLPVDGGYLAQ